MAIILNTVVTPANYSPVRADIWFGLSTTSYTLTDFKYIFDILKYSLSLSSSSTIGSYRVPPRPTNGYGLISPSKLLRTQLTYSFQPNVSIPYTLTSGIVKFAFRYGFAYNPSWGFSDLAYFPALSSQAWLVNSTGTSWDVQTGDTITLLMTNRGINDQFNGDTTVMGLTYSSGLQFVRINKAYASSTFGAQSGIVSNIKRMTGTSSVYNAYQGTRQYTEINTNFSNSRVILSDNNPQNFLSNYKNLSQYTISVTNSSPYIYGNTKTIYANQFETVSMLLDPSATQSYVKYTTYNSNYAITGNYEAQLQPTLSSAGLYIRYDLPAGTSNLINGGYIPSATMSASRFYQVSVYNQAGASASKYMKAIRFYEIVDNCSPYPKNYRICFLNRHGGTDYWNFNWKATNTLTQAPSIFRKQLAYNYTVGDRQDTVLSNKANETFVVSTDWISQYDAEFLKELITSPDVSVYDEATQTKLPIIILDTSYLVKTAIDNKLFCITLNFRYSYDINLQNN